LIGDQGREVTVDLALFQTQTGHPAGVLWTKPETAKAYHQSQSGEVFLGVLAIPVGLPGRGWDDPDRLVPADRRGCDAGPLGEFGDPHARASAGL